jgi:hypothetical protein
MWEKIKNFFSKFGVVCFCGLILAAVLTVLFFVMKYNADTAARQTAIENSLIEMKTLSDGIVRAQSQYATKDDLKAFADNLNLNLTEIQKDLDSIDAKIAGISTLLVSTPGYHGSNLPSDHTTPNTDPNNIPVDCRENGCDPFGYTANAQTKDISEPFSADVSVPVGQATFSAWLERPWDLTIFPRDYVVDSVLGVDKKGQHTLYHKFTIQSNGKTYQVPIKSAKFVEQYPEASFSWWNPKFGLGVIAGLAIPTLSGMLAENGVTASVSPSVFFAPFSYGKTDVKPRFIFPQVGVGYDTVNQSAVFSLSPFMYNLGDTSTIINNLYSGPTLSYDHRGNFTIGGTLSLSL